MSRTSREYRILASDSTVHVTNLQAEGEIPNFHCPVLKAYSQGMHVENPGKTYGSAAEITPAFLSLGGKRKICSSCADALSLMVRADANRAAEDSVKQLSAAAREITAADLRDLTEYTDEELHEAASAAAEAAIDNIGMDDDVYQFLPRGARGNPDAQKKFSSRLTRIRVGLRDALKEME